MRSLSALTLRNEQERRAGRLGSLFGRLRPKHAFTRAWDRAQVPSSLEAGATIRGSHSRNASNRLRAHAVARFGSRLPFGWEETLPVDESDPKNPERRPSAADKPFIPADVRHPNWSRTNVTNSPVGRV